MTRGKGLAMTRRVIAAVKNTGKAGLHETDYDQCSEKQVSFFLRGGRPYIPRQKAKGKRQNDKSKRKDSRKRSAYCSAI
jgi:hypothetical protein